MTKKARHQNPDTSADLLEKGVKLNTIKMRILALRRGGGARGNFDERPGRPLGGG